MSVTWHVESVVSPSWHYLLRASRTSRPSDSISNGKVVLILPFLVHSACTLWVIQRWRYRFSFWNALLEQDGGFEDQNQLRRKMKHQDLTSRDKLMARQESKSFQVRCCSISRGSNWGEECCQSNALTAPLKVTSPTDGGLKTLMHYHVNSATATAMGCVG